MSPETPLLAARWTCYLMMGLQILLMRGTEEEREADRSLLSSTTLWFGRDNLILCFETILYYKKS
jgi:hypothetical protein